jgi:shikimate dehydrogenase
MAVSKHLGAREILWVSRGERESCITYDELKEHHRDTEVIINTTPCGMYPHAQETPIDLEGFDNLSCVADAIYNPLRTCLVSTAKEKGIPAEGGLFMLVAQAVRASEIFLGVTYPVGTVERIWKTLERQKENIVLVGMPGSGKTTVGNLLAKRMDRELLDMDVLLTEKQGRTPSEIIREDGESAFRNMETALLRDTLAHVTGKIISTGGGAILREENRRMLRQNGRVYLLDRPWQKLLPTDDRPLSSTVEAMKARYLERREAYLSAADIRVEDPASAADAAETIGKDFCR